MKTPTIRKEADGVYSLTYDTRYDLCMSFVRIQEFYESPEFMGRFFTLEEFMDYWAKEFGDGSFDYPAKWAGFNVPGPVLADWWDMHCEGVLRDKEQIIYNKLDKRLNRDNMALEDIYLIGVSRDSKDKRDIVSHELAHAFYTLDSDYKNDCNKLLESIRKTKNGKLALKSMKDELIGMGYCNKVIPDEIQAYWSNLTRLPETSFSDPLWAKVLEFNKLFMKLREGK